MIENKRGVSIMIGYILLVAAVLAMSIVVYTWLKTYVPKEPIECADGVSIYVKSFDCGIGELIIKNNGRFSVAGFFIKGTESPEQEIATKDLAEFCTGGDEGRIVFAGSDLTADPPANTLKVNMQNSGEGESVLNPAQLITCDFNDFTKPIYSLEIIPFRYEVFDGKSRQVVCSKAKIREAITGGCPAA